MAEGQLRRQSWGGAKKYVKRLLAVPGVAQLAHGVVSRVSPEREPQRLPVPWTVQEVRGRAADVTFTMLDPARCVVAKELYWGAGRRPGSADQLAIDCFARLAPAAELIIDVGAYTGIFSLVGALASPTAQVDAYELVPENYVALIRNLVANDLVGGRVHAHLAGVGAPGTTVRVPTGRGGSALPDFYSTETDFTAAGSTVGVALVGLDDRYGSSSEPRSVLIKIDVEGGEDEVLAQATTLLQRDRPTILCEVLPERGSALGLNRLLEPYGYSFFRITDHGLRQSPQVVGAEDARDWLITTMDAGALQALGIPAE